MLCHWNQRSSTLAAKCGLHAYNIMLYPFWTPILEPSPEAPTNKGLEKGPNEGSQWPREENRHGVCKG